MKRSNVPRLGDEPASLSQQQPTPMQQQPGVSNMHTLAQTAQPQLLGAAAMLSVGGQRSRPVLNYMKPVPVTYAPKHTPPHPPHPPHGHQAAQVTPRHKPMGGQPNSVPMSQQPMGNQSPVSGPVPAAQFQRLKVEDALSYLDQVKYKFNTQPQVYNDFLDIMKEFKSQTIDTPGVITRVSNLFKGHPELIVGFNTFLPPGYKIEVQSNGQVSVSMPSPTALGASGVLVGVHHTQQQLVHLLPVPVPQSVPTAIVHNLSVNAPPANTLHHISQAHQQIEAAAIHHAPNAMPTSGSAHVPAAPPGQPVEFNHAIEYVNKIKSRFSRQPDKYKRFLEILHAYQRGHRDTKQTTCKQQTEQEVYSQVAKLFENQDDLLAEFGQFLPDAKTVVPPAPIPQREFEEKYVPPSASPPAHHQQMPKHLTPMSSNLNTQPPQHNQLKRSPSFTSNSQIGMSAPPLKKPRGGCGPPGAPAPAPGAPRDVSYAEAAKLGTMQEYNFFDRVRKALKNHHVYDNFLRCLLLYTHEVISSSELVTVTSGFLSRHPELRRWLQHFVAPDLHHDSHGYKSRSCSVSEYEPLGPLAAHLRHDRPQGDAAMDIDLSTCKRLGTSYCALPRGSAEAASRKCSGRTPLCKEVLNDTWVSFPTWSEDSTFVTSRKTQYEEYIYRCEDERFELDVVIETNAATIRVLEGVQKKLSRMSPDEATKYRLDDTLGGHSQTIHQRALRRIYGDKVAVDIIAGLKKNPVVAVPVVLRRLKAKEEEWREAQKGFNKQWREQNEKYYLKSLDHQGINFKQNDLKAMRSKSLFNEVESAYAARKPAPHVTVDYNMTSRQEAIKIVRDAAELLIHHARRQTGIQKAEKRRIKHLLRVFLPDLFNHPRQPLSDDERDSEEKEESPPPSSPLTGDSPSSVVKKEREGVKEERDSDDSDVGSDHRLKDKENTPKNHNRDRGKVEPAPLPNNVKRPSSAGQDDKTDIKKEINNSDDDYRDHATTGRVMVCTSSWYLFLRLHGSLCSRLSGASRAATQLANNNHHHTTVAQALRLKPNNLPAEVNSPADYYNALLDLVKGVLDGNMESGAYEDAAREMLGIKAYPAYTLDKLVSYAVRQLQHCVSEPWSVRCAEMAAGRGNRGASYIHMATRYLAHHHTAFLVTFYSGEQCRVEFELVSGSADGRTSPQLNQDQTRMSPTLQSTHVPPSSVVGRVASWSTYCERYVRPDLSSGPLNKPVFLRRNITRTNGPPNVTNLASSGVCPESSTQHARRKPHKIHDFNECTIANRLRLVAARPYNVYRKGCLTSARLTHAKLHAARRARLRAWLQTKQT